jgi:hypothetical protein
MLTDVTEKTELFNFYFDSVVSIKNDDLQTREGRANRFKRELRPKVSQDLQRYHLVALNEFKAPGQTNFFSEPKLWSRCDCRKPPLNFLESTV